MGMLTEQSPLLESTRLSESPMPIRQLLRTRVSCLRAPAAGSAASAFPNWPRLDHGCTNSKTLSPSCQTTALGIVLQPAE